MRKTIVFVTHDIDEAVRLGDRIAVSWGRRAAAVRDPGALLAAPANEYVAAFVGADRGIRRMSVTELTEADLEHPTTVAEGDDVARRPTAHPSSARAVGWASSSGGRVAQIGSTVPLGANLRQAFAVLAGSDDDQVPVLDGERYVGSIGAAGVHHALRRSAPH